MFNFFAGIADIIGTVVNFVITFSLNLVMVLQRSAQAVVYVVSVIMFLPEYVKVFILAMIGFSALLFVINKGD